MAARSLAFALALTACTAGDGVPELGRLEKKMSVCADGPTVYGIDVSRFQGDIDWQQVADSGVVYAWIQISRSLTDIDQKFDYNWRRAKEVGILRGAYQRFQPGQDVAGQAQLFLDRHGPMQPGDMPPMLDVEDTNGLGPAAIAAAVQQWMDIVEPALGVRPLIYTGFYFWRDQVGGADFSQYPLWVPNYSADCPLVPPAWTRWAFHQYSSSAVIPGITANTVDVNRFNGTMDDLLALAAGGECGDGVCNGGESPDSCLEDCPPCQIVEAEGGIVEDSSECFQAGGNPAFIRHESAGHGGSLQWTHTTDLTQVANYGLWNLYLAEAGRYRVEAHTPAPYGESRQAVYQIAHAGEATAVEVDQSAVDGWNLIADIEFAAGGGQSIRVDDNTGEPNGTETQIVFDAIRLTRLDSTATGEGDGDVEPGDEGAAGCAMTGPGAGGFPGLMLLAVALISRRRCRRTATLTSTETG